MKRGHLQGRDVVLVLSFKQNLERMADVTRPKDFFCESLAGAALNVFIPMAALEEVNEAKEERCLRSGG